MVTAAFVGPKSEMKTGNKTFSVDGTHLGEVLLRRVELTPDAPAYLVKREGAFQPIVWSEVFDKVARIADWLHAQNLAPQDKICIFSNSRPEWAMIDAAIWSSGWVTVPIYQSSNPEDIAYILRHSDAKVIFAEDAVLADRCQQALAAIGRDLPIVLIATKDEKATQPTLPAILAAADPKNGEAKIRAAQASLSGELPASLVYTSGTTGRPKGAVILHRMFCAELRSALDLLNVTSADSSLTFLPFAHVLGRVESLMPLFAAMKLAFAENINAVSQNLVEVKPTVLVSVPRIYEKIYAKIQNEIAAQPPLRQKIFNWAVNLGRDVKRKQSNGDLVPWRDSLRLFAVDRAVFKRVRDAFGGQIRFTISGGAPLAREIAEFFHACGVPILEGYGLTETTAACFVNRPDDVGFGTVGRSLGNTEVRIANDGEIQVRGPVVFHSYYNDPDATKEGLTSDGWFCTGDIGEIDPKGRLRITDRKKELIVTSGGKNIAPQKLENLIKQIRFVNNAVVFGDRQKYLGALLTLNEGAVRKWVKSQGDDSNRPWEDLAHDPKVEGLLQTELKGVNGQLASYETIKRFRILPKDFTIESGEMTPSLKIKRKVVAAKYKETIDQLFH